MTDIAFIQKGETFYFPLVLRQVLRKCPESRIFVITDAALPHRLVEEYPKRLVRVNITEVDETGAAFRPHYVHLSPNRLWLERFCLERWFYLLETMKREGLKQILYLDSDVLVLEDLSAWTEGFPDEPMMFSRGHGPHFSFFGNPRRLEDLCNLIYSTYTDPGKLSELQDWHRQEFIEKGRQGGVCDMTFFERYVEELGENYIDTSVIREGRFVDHCFRMHEGYETRWGGKRVWKQEGLYVCRIKDTGDWVSPLAFHFQGGQKIRMPLYFEKRNLADWCQAMRVFFAGIIAYTRKFPHYLKRRIIHRRRRRATLI